MAGKTTHHEYNMYKNDRVAILMLDFRILFPEKMRNGWVHQEAHTSHQHEAPK